jgi:hypothetical protein
MIVSIDTHFNMFKSLIKVFPTAHIEPIPFESTCLQYGETQDMAVGERWNSTMITNTQRCEEGGTAHCTPLISQQPCQFAERASVGRIRNAHRYHVVERGGLPDGTIPLFSALSGLVETREKP